MTHVNRVTATTARSSRRAGAGRGGAPGERDENPRRLAVGANEVQEVAMDFGTGGGNDFDRTMEIDGGFLPHPPETEASAPELLPPLKR